MSNDNIYQKPGSGKIFVGILLLFFGGALLLQQITFFIIPHWFWRWPTWLIVIGLWSGAKHNFKTSGWVIMVLIGLIFLADDIIPGIDLHRLFWPIILIAGGLWIILGRHDRFGRDCVKKKPKYVGPNPWDVDYKTYAGPADPNNPLAGDIKLEDPLNPGDKTYGAAYDSKLGDDYIDTTSIFGSVNKTILSKDFKGGHVVNVFGGTELNFTQADINGKVFIDIEQIFGGIKLFVPPHWQVTSDMAAVFAGIDDKRRNGTIALNPDKILVLKGTSVFAGIEIRSY